MRYFVTVSYDGVEYVGWQTQADFKSVQGSIERALYHLTKEKIIIHGSGRTDRGVHALGQVFHFDSDMKNITEKGFMMALNARLDDDIRITDVKVVGDAMHARKSAKAKVYAYHINMGEYQLFKRNYQLQYCKELDVEAMKMASQYLIGKHDFTSFCANTKEEKADQVRTIYAIDFIKKEDELIIRFEGNGFLRYMVRMMCAILVQVGAHKYKPERVEEVLKAKDKNAFNQNIDACGLYLVEVKY